MSPRPSLTSRPFRDAFISKVIWRKRILFLLALLFRLFISEAVDIVFAGDRFFVVFFFFKFSLLPISQSAYLSPNGFNVAKKKRRGAAAPMTPRACACFQMAPGKRGAGGPAGSGGGGKGQPRPGAGGGEREAGTGCCPPAPRGTSPGGQNLTSAVLAR